jgi:hypothetical protein
MSASTLPEPSYDGVLSLAADALRLHARATADLEVRVSRPSAPVLFFGDLDGYRRSALRVITVGVNPSGEEFPAAAPWSRFPGSDVSSAAATREQIDQYLGSLNNYFDGPDPYRRWFDRSYEPVLNGLGGSYYRNDTFTALHTDVCTPLPTTPTWRFLSQAEQRALIVDGVPLWHRLVDELAPDVILASVSGRHFQRIQLEHLSHPEVIYTVEQKRPFEVIVRRVLCGRKSSLLLWAPASTTPFQPISHDHKRAVGATIRSLVDG